MSRRHPWLPEASLIFFMLFAEPIPLAARVGDAPAFFSIQHLLMLLPWMRPLPSWTLLVPALLFLLVAMLPVRGRGLQLGLPPLPEALQPRRAPVVRRGRGPRGHPGPRGSVAEAGGPGEAARGEVAGGRRLRMSW